MEKLLRTFPKCALDEIQKRKSIKCISIYSMLLRMDGYIYFTGICFYMRYIVWFSCQISVYFMKGEQKKSVSVAAHKFIYILLK